MESNPRVSVVVVTYNQEDTIGRTLDSILGQEKDFPIEIIIGDDASTDNTERVCKEYAKRYPDVIRYIRNEKNKGLRDNYYDCLLMARGEYIADVAGDDFWIDKEKLKKQVKILEEEPDVVLVCTDWKNYDVATGEYKSPWGEGSYPYKEWFDNPDLQVKLLSHIAPNAVHLCTSLYRAHAFRKIYQKDTFVFRHKDFKMEDLQLTVMLSTVGRIKYLDEPTLAYSVNGESMSGTKDFVKLFDLYFGSIAATHYLADKLGLEQSKLIDVYRRMLHFIIMQAYHASDHERMALIKKFIGDRSLSLDFKTKIILTLSNSRAIWAASRSIWQKMKSIR